MDWTVRFWLWIYEESATMPRMADLSVLSPVIAGFGFLASIGTTLLISGRRSGKESAEVEGLKLNLTDIKSLIVNHGNDTGRHTTPEVRAVEKDLMDQRFKNQDLQLDSRFNEVLLRLDQLGNEIKAINTKVDRALAVASSISSELHSETTKLAGQIGELRGRKVP